MRKLLLAILTAGLLAGCSSEPQKPAEAKKGAEAKAAAAEAKAPELLTGRAAFQKLFATARMWAPDAKPFRLQSQTARSALGADGKAGVWRGSFASTAKRAVKPYVWSGITAEDAPGRGVNPGVEDTFNPSNSSTQPFDFGFLKVDSDKAFEAAQQHGGKKILDKTPDQPVTYILDWNPATNELMWHVIYGTSAADAKLRVAVDATTGDSVRVEK